MSRLLNPASTPRRPPYEFVPVSTDAALVERIDERVYAGRAHRHARQPTGQLDFQLLTGERSAPTEASRSRWGTLADRDLRLDEPNSPTDGAALPAARVQLLGGGRARRTAADRFRRSEYAGRRIVGVVFVVLIFITLVIYGMWVAAGVVAEKSSRVMELLVSAASPAQLVVGKVVGIGLAGAVQYVAILVPALLTLAPPGSDRDRGARLGERLDAVARGTAPGPPRRVRRVLDPRLPLYALIYAAAGSLVSRAEDLQVLALPLSLIAITGYFLAVLALSGGISGSSGSRRTCPFWSPFVMLTRLTVGRVEPWELVLSFGLLAASIPIVGADRGAGLLRGRPALRAATRRAPDRRRDRPPARLRKPRHLPIRCDFAPIAAAVSVQFPPPADRLRLRPLASALQCPICAQRPIA